MDILESPEQLMYKIKLLVDNGYKPSTIARVTGVPESIVLKIIFAIRH